jgi:polysaccharide biosynthesis transport protein
VELLIAAKVLIAALRRQKIIAATVFLAVFGTTLSVYMLIGERYQAEALLLVGNGYGERLGSGNVLDPNGINSLARLVVTNDVLRDAATKVGFGRLFPNIDALQRTDGSLIAMLRSSVSAQPEGKSDLLKISFRHRDPVVAADFVNALADSLNARQAELLNVPGAFFEMERKRLKEEVQKAASNLEKFSAAVAIYSVNDQRALLLKQANELAGSIASTRGSILERRGQKEALIKQVLMLKPVTQSKFVSGIVNSWGADDLESTVSHNTKGQPEEQSLSAGVPILFTHVYQDALVALFKVNADLAGARYLETQLATELKKVNEQLAALSSREAEFNQLSRELTLAVTAAESYEKRMIEEQINMSLANARVSSVRIAQLADPPELPAFPQFIIFLVLGLAGGAVLASAAAVLPEALAGLPPLGLGVARNGNADGSSPSVANWTPASASVGAEQSRISKTSG